MNNLEILLGSKLKKIKNIEAKRKIRYSYKKKVSIKVLKVPIAIILMGICLINFV